MLLVTNVSFCIILWLRVLNIDCVLTYHLYICFLHFLIVYANLQQINVQELNKPTNVVFRHLSIVIVLFAICKAIGMNHPISTVRFTAFTHLKLEHKLKALPAVLRT